MSDGATPASVVDTSYDALVQHLDAFGAGLDQLSTRELSALNRKMCALAAEFQKRTRAQDSLGPLPHLMALNVAQVLVGRLIDDPVSWQRVERLIRALGDADREKLFLSIEKRRGWVVRKATAERWVSEAGRRGPQKSEDRLELLALARCLHDDGMGWNEILPQVNAAARGLGLTNNSMPLSEKVHLYATSGNLKTAVSKERNNRQFTHYVAQWRRILDEHDATQDLTQPAA